jgi:hypothetical protein
MTSPQVLANLGVLAFRRKEFVRADDYFSSALEVAGPLRKPLCWSHANTALLSGRLNLAFERYTKIDREFACYDGQMGLAACYVLRGDFERAGACWEKASEKGNFAGVDRNLKAKAQLEATGERISGYQPITVFSDLFY